MPQDWFVIDRIEVNGGEVTFHLGPTEFCDSDSDPAIKKYREEELRGQELLKELKPEWAEEYRTFHDSITIPSKIFPIDYRVYHNTIYTGKRGQDKENGQICIGINQDMPYADKILSLGLFLEHDEEGVLREGNWIPDYDWGGISAWKVLCRKYPLHALIYHLKRWIKSPTPKAQNYGRPVVGLINVQGAYEAYARAWGRRMEELTDLERSRALMNSVFDNTR